MDERPLRQEDYRAMAEENRRLHKRIAQLQEERKINYMAVQKVENF